VATALHTTLKTNTTLSGGNLVATSTGAGGARSDRPITGLTYFSAVITTLTGAPQIGIARNDYSGAAALGSQTSSVGYVPTTGIVQYNGATLATIQTSAQGNRIDCAVNWPDRLIWFRTNAGNWNNNVANDPATGVGGIDISGVAAPGTMVAAVYASLTGNVWTMEFSTAFTNAPPTGYASLDVVGYVRAQWVCDPRGAPVTGGLLPASFSCRASSMPRDGVASKWFNGTTITVVSGITKEGGVAAGNKRVEVYDRNTGELLNSGLSDGSGNWSLPCLGRPAVRVVGSDPTTYNSVVFDNVVPV
jgi:hypothetical protein